MTAAQQQAVAAPPAPLPDAIRHRFPIFRSLVYLNSCSHGALSTDVRRAYDDYLDAWQRRGPEWDVWEGRMHDAREAFARLIGALPDEVAVTSSVSAAVSALASALDFARRRKVVLSDVEFPTVGQIWHAQERRGALVVHAPPEALGRELDGRPLLLSVTHVGYSSGVKLDVPALVSAARANGAYVLLDAYQSVGSVPLDVRRLDVDFLVAGTFKYLLGTPGVAFLYCRRDLVESLRPTTTGWFADEDVHAMDATDYSPAPTAARFQSGTPAVPSLYASAAGLSLVAEVGVDAIRRHVNRLNTRLLDGLDELGASVVTPREPERRGALVCVRARDADTLVEALRGEGIVVSQRASNLRISPHAYNAVDDIDALLGALRTHRRLLA